MRSTGFRRFVAVFVGVVLALALGFGIAMNDESMIGFAAAIAGVYAVYLYFFIKKEKALKSDPTSRQSPLIRK